MLDLEPDFVFPFHGVNIDAFNNRYTSFITADLPTIADGRFLGETDRVINLDNMIYDPFKNDNNEGE